MFQLVPHTDKKKKIMKKEKIDLSEKKKVFLWKKKSLFTHGRKWFRTWIIRKKDRPIKMKNVSLAPLGFCGRMTWKLLKQISITNIDKKYNRKSCVSVQEYRKTWHGFWVSGSHYLEVVVNQCAVNISSIDNQQVFRIIYSVWCTL